MAQHVHIVRIAWLPATLALLLACADPAPTEPEGPDPLAFVLAPQSASDGEIAQLQERARRQPRPVRALERLGWTYLSRARSQEDPGYYALAEHTGRALATLDGDAGALLLARALHGQHRFAEAEREARALTERAGGPFDWAVLGDALFDQGRIDEAARAYERMMALRPDAQAFARFAEVLFVRGDLAGATEAMWRGARSVGFRHAGARAWMESRLARYLLHQGEIDAAERVARNALATDPESLDARASLGRVQLARDDWPGAAATLGVAERSDRPLLLWALAEALRAGGRAAEAARVEARLEERGARGDPRGYALYLASRGRHLPLAVSLAREELVRRRDVFTLDTLAWCEHAAGDAVRALELVRAARAIGTRDARLDYHAGVIALSAGAWQEAETWLGRARAARRGLLPSERERLAVAESELSVIRNGRVERPAHHLPSHHGEPR